jgi:O-antigen/teichoic acid export membrane protein
LGFQPTSSRNAQDSEGSAILRGAILNLAGGVGTAVGAFGVTVIVGRTLGPGESASFFEAVAIFTILTIIGQAGSAPGLVWAVASALAEGRDADVRPYVRTATLGVAAVSTVLGLGLFLSAGYVSGHLSNGGSSQLRTSLRVMAVFLPAACLSTMFLAATRGFSKMTPSVVVDCFSKQAIRILAVGVGLAISKDSLGASIGWSLPIGFTLVGSVLWLGVLLSTVNPDPKQQSASVASHFWRFSSFQVASDFFQVGVQWLDVLLLGLLGTAHATGTYAAVSRVAFVGLLGLVAIGQVVAPRISASLATGDNRGAQSLYQTSTLWLCVISVPFYLLIAVFSGVVTKIFGPGFQSGSAALTILSLAMLVNVCTGPVMSVLVMGGKSGLGMIDTGLALAVNVGLNIVLIPPFGIVGAAFAWTASIFVVNVLSTMQIRRLWYMSPFSSDYRNVLLAAIITYGATSLLISEVVGQSIHGLALAAAVATPLYIVLLSRTTIRRDLLRLLARVKEV